MASLFLKSPTFPLSPRNYYISVILSVNISPSLPLSLCFLPMVQGLLMRSRREKYVTASASLHRAAHCSIALSASAPVRHTAP